MKTMFRNGNILFSIVLSIERSLCAWNHGINSACWAFEYSNKSGFFYPQLMHEFIANLPAQFNDPSSPDYQKVHICCFCLHISSAIISSFLGHDESPYFGSPHPLIENLIVELTGGTKSSCPWFGQLFTVVLSVKYVVLHKIEIANWCPSTHGSGLSPTLASLLYQIGTRFMFDFEVFVVNQLLHHVDSFAIKLLISPGDALGLDLVVLNLNYKLFQGSHVLDIVHNIRPPKTTDIPLHEDLQARKGGLHISPNLGTCIFCILSSESRTFKFCVWNLTDRRGEIDAFVHLLSVSAPPTDGAYTSKDHDQFVL